jgi:hypothetical protein
MFTRRFVPLRLTLNHLTYQYPIKIKSFWVSVKDNKIYIGFTMFIHLLHIVLIKFSPCIVPFYGITCSIFIGVYLNGRRYSLFKLMYF